MKEYLFKEIGMNNALDILSREFPDGTTSNNGVDLNLISQNIPDFAKKLMQNLENKQEANYLKR